MLEQEEMDLDSLKSMFGIKDEKREEKSVDQKTYNVLAEMLSKVKSINNE